MEAMAFTATVFGGKPTKPIYEKVNSAQIPFALVWVILDKIEIYSNTLWVISEEYNFSVSICKLSLPYQKYNQLFELTHGTSRWHNKVIILRIESCSRVHFYYQFLKYGHCDSQPLQLHLGHRLTNSLAWIPLHYPIESLPSKWKALGWLTLLSAGGFSLLHPTTTLLCGCHRRRGCATIQRGHWCLRLEIQAPEKHADWARGEDTDENDCASRHRWRKICPPPLKW